MSASNCKKFTSDGHEIILKVRTGQVSHPEVMNTVKGNLETMHTLEAFGRIPKEPDKNRVNEFMVQLLNDYFYGTVSIRDIREEVGR